MPLIVPVRLKDWFFIERGSRSKMCQPSFNKAILCGAAYGHVKHDNGTVIHVSKPIAYCEHTKALMTKNGSFYRLLFPHDMYLKICPDAINKIEDMIMKLVTFDGTSVGIDKWTSDKNRPPL